MNWNNPILQVPNLTQEEIIVLKWNIIRQHRNDLLSRSDWTQLPDTVLTQAERTAWQVYREALQVIEFSNANPDLIDFPNPPDFVNALPSQEVLDYRTSRTDLKAQVMDAVTRLQGIQNAGTIPFTQAGFTQVVNAIKDMALYEEKIIRVLARII